MKGILAVLFFGVILAFNTAPFAHVKSHDLSITYEDQEECDCGTDSETGECLPCNNEE